MVVAIERVQSTGRSEEEQSVVVLEEAEKADGSGYSGDGSPLVVVTAAVVVVAVVAVAVVPIVMVVADNDPLGIAMSVAVSIPVAISIPISVPISVAVVVALVLTVAGRVVVAIPISIVAAVVAAVVATSGRTGLMGIAVAVALGPVVASLTVVALLCAG